MNNVAMPTPEWLEPARQIALLAALAAAGYWDVKERRIPNQLSVAVFVAGAALAVIGGGTEAWWGMACAGGVVLLFYLGGGMGGGDVKLAFGFGLLAGFPAIVYYLFYGSLAALALAAGRLGWRGEFWKTMRAAVGKRPRFWRFSRAKDRETAAKTETSAGVSLALAWLLGVGWVWVMELL